MKHCTYQWFLTGGRAPPQGERQYISVGRELLYALQHEQFDQ